MQPQKDLNKIRRARPDDLTEICQLAGQLGYPDQPERIMERLKGILENPSQEIFVAETADRKVIGFIQLCLQTSLVIDPIVEVCGLVVDREFHRLGIGKALLNSAEEWTKSKGCSQIRLHSNIIRSEAHKFYNSQGYAILKTQHAFIKKLA